MNAIIPILVLGVIILVLVGRLVLQSSHAGTRDPAVAMADYWAARRELGELFFEVATIQRIFAMEDMNFISQNAPLAVQTFFRNERKALALLWVRRTRSQVSRLMDIHLRLASFTTDPNPKSELKLSIQYFAFMVWSYFLFIVLWLRGPFEPITLLTYTVRLTGFLCDVFNMRLKDIDPGRLSSHPDAPLP